MSELFITILEGLREGVKNSRSVIEANDDEWEKVKEVAKGLVDDLCEILDNPAP